ncbi:MAG: phosphotransferase [Gammaproteobacteria bacterium]|nr:phosphotransferase [Gammaproteobacteria bacterium]
MHGVLAALHYSGIVARGSTAAATQFGGMMDSLLKWCATRVRPLAGAELVLRAVAGDASFRRYFRLVGCLPTRIAVHAPPDKERNLEFIHIAAILRAAGVQAPEVLAHEPGEGFLLLSDLGDTLLLGALGEDTVEALYRTALDTLLAIQGPRYSTAGGERRIIRRRCSSRRWHCFPSGTCRACSAWSPMLASAGCCAICSSAWARARWNNRRCWCIATTIRAT